MGFKPDLWRPSGFLQCFDTVGLVISPVKIVPEMNYYVSSGTLNPTHSLTHPCPSPPFPFLYPFVSQPLPFLPLFFFSPAHGSPNPARGHREHCKHPQQHPGGTQAEKAFQWYFEPSSLVFCSFQQVSAFSLAVLSPFWSLRLNLSTVYNLSLPSYHAITPSFSYPE